MGYFIRKGIHPFQVWKIDDQTAVRLGVTNPERGAGTYYKAEPGETIWDAIRRCTPWFQPHGENPFVATVLEPGEYFPRMARPTEQTIYRSGFGWYPNAKDHADSIALARVQLTALARQLDRICQTVHPSIKTFDVFGHDIRNLLILACTEVENHWREVLVANGVIEDRYNTGHYVKLRKPMKLDEYAVAFPNYPWIEPLKPFDGWGDTGRPTQDLGWYDAYNAVKHARETEFERGTLRHLFSAISACAVMIVAQFGLHAELEKSAELRSFFHFSATPAWGFSEIYVSPYDSPTGEWRVTSYDFSRC
ncbi:MAG: hypothetical protein KGJ28_04460 [Alphaproteobacteria bacterium]|nr:hypothetical protein [Alphaproteobacteria bacterium]